MMRSGKFSSFLMVLLVSLAFVFHAARAGEENSEAVSHEDLLRDWVLQDCGKNVESCFVNKSNADIEQKLVARVLEELGAEGAPFQMELERLIREGIPADDRLWRDLYSKACRARRRIRLDPLIEKWREIVFTRHFNLGGSHYAYTENQSDAQYEERRRHNADYCMGAALCVLEIFPDGTTCTGVLLEDRDGVIRDPDVSFDGRRILFAWRKSPVQDDYHLHELDRETGRIRQLTFGLGFADYEGVYLPGGDILFNSTRCVQTVDCWWTEVSNLYACNRDGRFLRRLTFDQVHTNYPQVLEDGRVIYTRWDYNDRGQIYPQPLFQMNGDGTAQTEFYGNNSWFPTSILHARGIPGTRKIVAVISGHHCHQRGKLAIIDPARGRQEAEGVQLIAPVRKTEPVRVDSYGQDGDQFQYPYPVSERAFLVSYDPLGSGNRDYQRPYGIYFMDIDGRRELLAMHPEISCSQPVPLAPRPVPHLRSSLVDYSRKEGTYFVQDVYRGPGLEGIERGVVKRLRVVALEFRAAGIGRNNLYGPAGGALSSTPVSAGTGSWDVKKVLGTTRVYPDGSAMFIVPARTPVYFQLLDEKNHVVQTMRSWSTLQPGEAFSCQGCHENKNVSAPVHGTTMAMRAGPKMLDPFHGPPRGFSFREEIQPILDTHCIRCHYLEKNAEPEETHAAFSLMDRPSLDRVSKRFWSESYLALTHSRMTDNGIHGEATDLVNWISAQSIPSMLPPYHKGAAGSRLITMLEAGHHAVKLDREEMDRIVCWIDLLVPFCGNYLEANAWSDAEKAKYEHFLVKRRKMEALEQENIQGLIEYRTEKNRGE